MSNDNKFQQQDFSCKYNSLKQKLNNNEFSQQTSLTLQLLQNITRHSEITKRKTQNFTEENSTERTNEFTKTDSRKENKKPPKRTPHENTNSERRSKWKSTYWRQHDVCWSHRR